jgi:hypothetical protein
MFPLLWKDGIAIPYVAFSALLLATSLSLLRSNWNRFLLIGCAAAMAALHVLWSFAPLIPRWLDLETLLIMVFSFSYFFCVWLYFNWRQFQLPTTERTNFLSKRKVI